MQGQDNSRPAVYTLANGCECTARYGTYDCYEGECGRSEEEARAKQRCSLRAGSSRPDLFTVLRSEAAGPSLTTSRDAAISTLELSDRAHCVGLTLSSPPKGEGEAARNNVVMSAGKRSCPGFICYLYLV